MEEALITYLLGVSAVSSVLSDRLNYNTKPQSTLLPCAVIQRVSGEPVYESNGASGLEESRIQVDCYGASYAEAKTVARAIIGALSGVRFIQGSIHFNSCFINFQNDRFEASNDGANKYHRVILDITIWHSLAS